MKKAIGILILVIGLFWSNVGVTEVKKFYCENPSSEAIYEVFERIIDTEKKTLTSRSKKKDEEEKKREFIIFEFDEDKVVYGTTNQMRFKDNYNNSLGGKANREGWNINNSESLQKLTKQFGPLDHIPVKFTWYYSEDYSQVEYLSTPYDKPSKKGISKSKVRCSSKLGKKIKQEEENWKNSKINIYVTPTSPESQLHDGYVYYITIKGLYKAREGYAAVYVNSEQFSDVKSKIKEIEKKIEKENEINTDKIWDIANKTYKKVFANLIDFAGTYTQETSQFADLYLMAFNRIYKEVTGDKKIEKDF